MTDTKREELLRFLSEFNYTEEEISGILEIYDAFSEKKEAVALFDKYYIPYREHGIIDANGFVEFFPEIAAAAGMNPIKLAFPLSALLITHSRRVYEKQGVSYKIWHDSMRDLRFKLHECKAVHGFWGHMSINWNKGWLLGTRYTLHRLQFEVIDYYNPDYKSERFDVKVGDKVINIHIPSDKELKFTPENCEISYALAREFFKDKVGGKVIFHCSSWLLYPEHSRILPESSNIRKFAESFEINPLSIKSSTNNLWRIFNTKELYEDASKYPENSELQRIYKKFLLEGGIPGVAQGLKL